MIKKVTPTGNLDQENDFPFIKDGDYRDALDVTSISDSNGNTISWEPKTQNTSAFNLGAAVQTAASWSIDFTKVVNTSVSPIIINVYRPGGLLVNGYYLYPSITYVDIPSSLATILDLSIKGQKLTTVTTVNNTSLGLSDVTYQITIPNGGNSFRVGQLVNTSGFGGTGYNVTKAVVIAVTATTFKVRVATPTGSAGTGYCIGSEDGSVTSSVDVNNASRLLYTLQSSYPWDYYITCNDPRVILRKESDAIDSAMVGSFKMCGGSDLLGDLFIMSTTSNDEQKELGVLYYGNSSGSSGLIITTDGPHGLQANETVYLYGISANGLAIQPEWLVQSISEFTPGSGIFDTFTVYGGEFDLFAAGLNNPIINGTITASSSAKVVRRPKTVSRISVATENKDSGLISCTPLITTSSFNFRTQNRIHLYCEDEGVRKSLYWCDGVNKDRVMYYTKEQYVTGGFLENNGGLYSLNEISNSTTLSIRQENVSFSFSSVTDSGGVLKSGNYRYAIRFLNKFFSASDWSDLSNIVNIYSASFSAPRAIIGDTDGTDTTKSVVLNVSGVPSIYEYYEVAYIRYDDVSYAQGAFRGSISASSFSIRHTGRETPVDFNVDELNAQNSFYNTSKSICALDNRLIRSNLTSEKQYDFSNFFKSWKHVIARKTKTSATKSLSEPWDNEKFSEYRDPQNVHYEKTFVPYETYRFSARVKLKGGSVINQNFWIDDILIDGNSISNSGNVYSDNRRKNTSLATNSLEFTDSLRNPYVYYVSFVDINWQYEVEGSPVRDLIDCVYIDYVEMTEDYREILTSGTIVMPASTSASISQSSESGSIVYGRVSSGNSYIGPFTGYYTDSVWTGRTKTRYSPGLLNNRLTDNNGTFATNWAGSSVSYTAPPSTGQSGFITTTAGSNSTLTQNPLTTTYGYIDQLNLWIIMKVTNRSFSSTAVVVGSNIVFTVASGHTFVVGSSVIAAGFGGSNYNGTYTVTGVSGNDITVAYSSVPSGTPGTGSLRLSAFPYTGNPIKYEKATGLTTNFSFSAKLNGSSLGSYGDEGYYAAAITGISTSYFKITVDSTMTAQICITDIYLMERGSSTTPYDAYTAMTSYESVTDSFQNYKLNAFFVSPDIYHNKQAISYLQGDQVIAYPLVASKTYSIETIGDRGGNGGCAFESIYQEYAYSVPAATSGCYPFTINVKDAKAIQPYGYDRVDTQNMANSTMLSITSGGNTKEEFYSMPTCIGLSFNSKIFDQIVNDSGLGYAYYYRPKGRGAKFQSVTDSKYVYSGYSKSSFDTTSIDVYGDSFVQNSFFKPRTRKGLSTSTFTYSNFGWGYGIGAYSFNRGNYQMEYKYSPSAVRLTDSATAWLESTEILWGLYTDGYSNRFDIKSTFAYDPDVQSGNRFPTRICYSDVKQNGSFSDDYRVFQLLNFRDLDLSNGEIVHHDIGKGELLTWQPRSFQRQYFRSAGLITSSNGMDVVVGDAGALTQRGDQISSIGTSHKWSIIKGKSRGGDDMFAWVNTETGDFVRFGSDGTVPISQVQSMMSSLRDKVKWADNKYTPSHDLGINGVWDDTNKSFHFVSRGVRNTHGLWNNYTTYTAPATGDLYVYLYVGSSLTPRVFKLIKGLTSLNENPTTNPSVWIEVFDYAIFNIDYSMIKGGFQSFHSWAPKTMLKWGRTFVSARPGYQESDIFIHNRGGTQYAYPGGGQIATNPYITPVCVLDPNMKTTYEAIELNSSALPSRIDFTTDQHVSYLLTSDFEQDEIHDNLWAAPIKNDSTVDANNPTGSNEIDTSNLFGKHLLVKYTFPSASKSKLFNFIIKLTPMSRSNNS